MLQLSDHEKRLLLAIARTAVRSHLGDGTFQKPDTLDGVLSRPCGVFVSIHREAQLRGCIGRVEPEGPLHETTIECAVSAAVSDSRFPPVSLEELDTLTFEISILSALEEVVTLDRIEVGRHGLLIEKDGNRGLLLPQVAVRHGWDRAAFASEACLKAGCAPDAWQGRAKVFAFEAVAFREGGTGR